MNETGKTHCPSPETLAAFSQGRLTGREAQAIVEHLDGCEECMSDVALAMEANDEESSVERFRPRPSWLLGFGVAAALIAVLSLPAVRDALQRPFRTSPEARLVALVPSKARLVEPRLTGGFAWAEYHGPARATEDVTDSQRLKLGGVAGELMERAEHDRGVEAQHAAGVAMVLVQKPVDAIARLEAAAGATRDPKQDGAPAGKPEAKDATIWSDLAAARYAAASSLGRASLYPAALAAADAALRMDPNLAEALFNRALILERMGLAQEARKAWQRYLEVDASSRWAGEARAHLAELRPVTSSSRFDRDRPLLERAAADGDTRRVRELVDLHRERSRAFAEGQYLTQWAEAWQRDDTVEATRSLAIARGIGDTLVQLSGESLLHDAVRTIDAADAKSRGTIAAAQVAYRAARIAYSRQQLDAAERGLRDAAARFESMHDPMALLARYYAASVRLARNDTTGAHAELARALADADAHPSFIALGAHVRWELGRALILDDDMSGAVPILTDGAAMFHRLGEDAGEAFVDGILAGALTFLGRADDAWSARIGAFAALSAKGDTEYLNRLLGTAMLSELRTGRRDCAMALTSLETVDESGGAPPMLVVETLIHRSMLESLMGNTEEGLRSARTAEKVAGRIADPWVRDRELADISVALGAALGALGGGDPQVAMPALTRAIDFYREHALPFGLPEPLLLRARSAVRNGDAMAASRDFEEGIATIERHPARVAGATIGTGVLDAEHALFTDAIRFRLDRGENAAAFSLVERWRGSASTVAELQTKLTGSGAAVLEIAQLPDELVTFAVAAGDFIVARRPRGAATYDDLIRPVDAVVSRARSLIIVPDPTLDGVSFAALYDDGGKRFLIERLPVAMASSAASLVAERTHQGLRSITAIGLPSGADFAALPAVEQELADVAVLYRHATTIPPARAVFASVDRAPGDVLHIAGHTEREPGGGEQALVFADRRVSWKTILAGPPLRARVVVLAACETLRAPASGQTRALSLAGAFSTAGAAEVIGTLTPIPDHDARMFFRVVHQQLARGAGAAEAVRTAQLESIARDRAGEGAGPWQSVAVVTRRIPAVSQ